MFGGILAIVIFIAATAVGGFITGSYWPVVVAAISGIAIGITIVYLIETYNDQE